MFVYTTGFGVNGFTLDPGIGEFLLSHPDIRIPEKCKTYSVNEGNVTKFSASVRSWLDYVKGIDGRIAKPWGLRYIGSMIADIHRDLLRGGIFLYPSTTESQKGKLRLLFEANPTAFIVEQAGGKAIDGKNNILEITPEALHQRTPLFIGNSEAVEDVKSYLEQDYLNKVNL
jgi:fructose-1,6-bisphosphatase I